MAPRSEDICRVILLCSLLFALFGCTGYSPPAKHYLLDTIDKPIDVDVSLKTDQRLRLCLGPVVFPKYLDRPQMVFRQDSHRVKIAQFDRWAEPLSDNFTRVLMENISRILNTDDIYTFPLTHRQVVDYRVGVTIFRFDVIPGKSAELSAKWSVYSGKDQSLLFNRKTIIQRVINHRDTPAIVATLNEMVTEFSLEIAKTIASAE